MTYLSSSAAGHQEAVEGEEVAVTGTFNATSTYRVVVTAAAEVDVEEGEGEVEEVVVVVEEEAAVVTAVVVRE